MDKTVLKDLKKGEKLFIVDLESVSIFPEKTLKSIVNSKKYKKTPFLFLIASKTRNEAISWANKNLNYKTKKETGSWMVYAFEKN